MLQLEVGKKYRRRDGKGPVEIVELNSFASYPYLSSEQRSYIESGHFYAEDLEDPRDLVAEWEEAPVAKSEQTVAEKLADPNRHYEEVPGVPAPVETLRAAAAAQARAEYRKDAFQIRALPHGGYVIAETFSQRGEYLPPIAAFSTVAEAAAFIVAHLSAEGK